MAPLFSEQLRQKRGIEDPEVLRKIEEISLRLVQSRTPSFYFEREYGTEDAEQALQDATFILFQVKKLLSLK